MSNPNSLDQFESDLRTVRRAAHLQRGRIVHTRLVETDRWDLEDLVSASERLSFPAEKYQQVAEVLGSLLPHLNEVHFSDPTITDAVTKLQELTDEDMVRSAEEQPSL